MRKSEVYGLTSVVSLRRKAAFTLLELLIVVAIIGILAAILMPAIGRVQERARGVQCASNLRQLHTGAMSFLADKGSFPHSASHEVWRKPDGGGAAVLSQEPTGWVASYPDVQGRAYWYEEGGSNGTWSIQNGTLFPYVGDAGDEAVYVCPTAARLARSNLNGAQRNIVRSYGMNRVVSGKPLRRIDGPSRTMFFADQGLLSISGSSRHVLTDGDGPSDSPPSGNPNEYRLWFNRGLDGSIDHDHATDPERIGGYHGRDARGPEGQANVVFVDGHVERIAYQYTDDIAVGDWENGAPIH